MRLSEKFRKACDVSFEYDLEPYREMLGKKTKKNSTRKHNTYILHVSSLLIAVKRHTFR